MSAVRIPLRFTAEDADRAFDEWGSNCGPGAIAAITGLTLDELRPNLGDFESKRYTNPTLMWEVLNRLGLRWRLVRPATSWPTYGLARVQWEGPWTAPGVPARAAYRHTHWVAAQRSEAKQAHGIFDINAMSSGGWISVGDWAGSLVPWLLSEFVPKANGGWHLTHVVEIALPRRPLKIDKTPIGAEIVVWTIYDSPRDCPGRIVVRPHFLIRGCAQPMASLQAWDFATIEEARAALPTGLTMLPRHEDDDPVIAETWS